jgi:electron transport complex protein RnfC
VELVLLHTKYPQGGERQLVDAVIKKEIPAGSLPADIGVIINNVGTAKAMADIMFTKTPLIARCITVTGKVKNPGNFYVPIGTPYATLIHEAGGFTTKNNRVIIGGPMTGNSIMIGGELTHLEGSVSKTSSGLLVLEDYSLIESPCIRCGECERVCPAGLAPFKIDFAAIEDNINLCEKLYATECISCGSCSYVCPANRELAYRITVAKTEIFNLRREKGGKR